MARVVIVGCGRRAMELARLLQADGHAVRGTTRHEERRSELEQAGIEPWIGDPDRIATVHYSMENATILCWFLASAEGDPEKVEALHGTRLEMMLERTIDSPVRGVLYEAQGSVESRALEQGASVVQRICDRNEIPWQLLKSDPSQPAAWAQAAKAKIDSLLSRDRG